MLLPSSLPLGVRSVEWVGAHHGNWLVDELESVYYGWKAPKKGGPQLKTLPVVGLAPTWAAKPRTTGFPAKRPVAAWPPRVRTVFAHRLPGEGVWKRTILLVGGRPPMLVTTFRTEPEYPRIVASSPGSTTRADGPPSIPADTSRRTRQ